MTPPPLRASIRQLMTLRSIATGGQSLAIAAAAMLGVALPFAPMAAIVGLLVVINGITWSRLDTLPEPTHADIAANLALDLVALTTLLYFSGGTTNPFSLLYVLHAVLMALLLPPVAAVAGTAVIVACYVVLTHVHDPLALATGEPLPASLAAFGLDLSLALTVGCAAWFVVRISAALRAHERRLAQATQIALRDEVVMRVGALAAGAAHELAAPLASMAVLAAEIENDASSSQTRHDAGKLRAQIAVCRDTITNLMAAAGHAEPASGGPERIDQFLESVAAACRTTRPEANVVSDWTGVASAPHILGDQALKQALLALLSNAVDASPDSVHFAAWQAGDSLRISLIDHGTGIGVDSMAKLGHAFISTKPRGKGAGLGVVLASRAIERLGGSLRWERGRDGGTRAEVTLPLGALRL